MEEEKKILIEIAKKNHEKIFPCAGKPWNECFTVYGDQLILWFNTEDKTTRVISSELKPN